MRYRMVPSGAAESSRRAACCCAKPPCRWVGRCQIGRCRAALSGCVMPPCGALFGHAAVLHSGGQCVAGSCRSVPIRDCIARLSRRVEFSPAWSSSAAQCSAVKPRLVSYCRPILCCDALTCRFARLGMVMPHGHAAVSSTTSLGLAEPLRHATPDIATRRRMVVLDPASPLCAVR